MAPSGTEDVLSVLAALVAGAGCSRLGALLYGAAR